MQCNSLILFTSKHRGCKVKITLQGEQAHFLNEDVIGKCTSIVVTSTMVISSQYQGKFIIVCMIHLMMIQLINVCYVFSVLFFENNKCYKIVGKFRYTRSKETYRCASWGRKCPKDY
jgi:hypothetical protein